MIRDKVQSKLSAAYNSKLADAVRSFSGSRESEGEYDPVTGTTPSEAVTYQGRGVFGSFSVEEVDDSHILVTDTKLSGVLQNELVNMVYGKPEGPITPAVGDTVDGYEVINVSEDPASSTWTLQLRKT